jgi:hypothetical protein
MKILPVGAKFFHADRRRDRQTNTTLTIAFFFFFAILLNAPNKMDGPKICLGTIMVDGKKIPPSTVNQTAIFPPCNFMHRHVYSPSVNPCAQLNAYHSRRHTDK